MRAITKALLEDCPYQLLGVMTGSVQIKAKRSLEFGCKGMVKKASLRCRTVTCVVEEGMREEYRDLELQDVWVNSHIDKWQVLDQVMGDIWLFEG